MEKVVIVLRNSLGCKLDSYECYQETAAAALRELLQDEWSVLNAGDRISVEEAAE